MVKFLVVDRVSAYNAIIGRTTLNNLKTVTSTPHLSMKFPTEEGVGVVKGDQKEARRCYNLSLKSTPRQHNLGEKAKEDGKQQSPLGEPVEGLEEFEIGDLGKKVCIGSQLPQLMKEDLVAFLRRNSDIYMEEADQEKTTFITDQGLYCYKMMPFGLKNTGATYQRLVNRMFRNQIGRKVERDIEANPEKVKAVLEMEAPRTTKQLQRLTGKIAALNRFISRSTDKCLPFFKILRKAITWSEECEEAFRKLKEYLTNPPLLSRPTEGEILYLYLAVSPSAGQVLADFLVEFCNIPEAEELPKELTWVVYVDGSSTRGRSGVGVLLRNLEGQEFGFAIKLDFVTTNNEAEYEAVIAGLALSREMGATTVEIRSDSQVVIPQDENIRADEFSKITSGIDEEIEASRRKIIVLTEPSITPKVAARKVKIQATRFCLLGEVLYKRGYSEPLLKCLPKTEADYVLKEIHEGVYGNHSGGRMLAQKTVRAGYYWPTISKDSALLVKHCDKCQRFSRIMKTSPEKLTPLTSPWPFVKWGVDIVGPMPVGKGSRKFLVVAVDYFTKWAEAKALATITTTNITKLRIQNYYSSVLYPKANGQVEATNKTLVRTLKKKLEKKKGAWVESVPEVFWSYRTTKRTPADETPFSLTYGTEAVILAEVGSPSFRVAYYNPELNDENAKLHLNLLQEKRDDAQVTWAAYQNRIARYFNKLVVPKKFQLGDWILRKEILLDAAQQFRGRTYI
ncbi:uncharacterized protein LOC133860372 [Alnus glutinosa]|uniref:uncharacterized protein LOC133860372 n=1 Tax=Alnus glutinosa TaxID=3517 RepID=UPI002D775906|nr:uncharacterized protein LOC133860372 [Alnus glutinosa]